MGTVAFLNAGCATVHLRPEPDECPEEALKAMKRFRRPREGVNTVWIGLDAKQIGGQSDIGVYADGPITGFWYTKLPQIPDFPEGTLLDGHLWVSAPGDRVFGRYTRARLPDGTVVPICIELCTNEGEANVGALKKGPGPREGTVLMGQLNGGCWTNRWH